MKRNSRREFLKSSTLASASLLIPQFLKASQGITLSEATRPRNLVVIQLSGGNDGLNCVVPYRNDIYYKLRPKLAINSEELIKLDSETGLNPVMGGIADLYHEGNAVLINSVGYPNPNRSHFRSMDIWQSASGSDEYLSSGWLGRVLDSTCNDNCVPPHFAVEVSDSLSLALKGEMQSGFALRDPRTVRRAKENELLNELAHLKEDHTHPEAAFLHKVMTDTWESTAYLQEAMKKYRSVKIYPGGKFGQQLKTVAELIISEADTRIYYLSLGGFDTHAGQRGAQDRQLKNWSEAVTVFCNELKEQVFFKDTIVLTFSEFGRRVEQNAANGTDHGTANNVYVFGGGLKKSGMYNDLPDLEDLIDGDLKYQTDFRAIYATLIDKWLNQDANAILNGHFGSVDFL